MLGGGQFDRQNKVLPGAYINFVSATRATVNMSERGVVTMPLELDWGVDHELIEVTQSDFIKDSMKLFGYSYTAERMQPLRELFKNATKGYIYKLTSGGEKATCAVATAKHSGIRGNDLRIKIVESVDEEGMFCVSVYLDSNMVDTQIVKNATELVDNDYVNWNDVADLPLTAGMNLIGGTNGSVTGDSHQKYLNAAESYNFNTMGVCTEDKITKALYAAYTRRMREQSGAKFQCVLYDCAADHEGIINVKNSIKIIPWVVGLEAACEVNTSCANIVYDGELEIKPYFTQTQLETAIESGEFVLHSVGNEVRVLKDINSLVTLTESKNELFQNNQTIRVLDQIAIDVSTLFNTKYHGKIQNNESGRISLWNDIIKYHKELQKLGAIENFSEEDVIVSAGESKDGVAIEDKITVVNAMSQLYMTVIIQ